MAQFLMSDFLSTVVADYAYTLNIAPHNEMEIDTLKTQKMLYTDDNDPLPLDIDGTSKYLVTLTWTHLSQVDAETIMELYNDSAKADGIVNSFRWTNPDDSNTYIVHFARKPLLKVYSLPHQSIDNVQLLVIGNYVP